MAAPIFKVVIKKQIIKMAKSTADNISVTTQAPQQKEVMNVPARESRIFLLSNDKRKGVVDIDVEEDVIDPKTGQTRRMRLLRGAQTLWFDEQPPTVFPEKYVNKNILTLRFVKGKCIIPVNEKLRVKAAELSNRNVNNPNKRGAKDIYFYEWNPIEQNKKAIQEENDIIKAMQLAMTVSLDEMIPHAQYLNIQFADEQGVPLNEEALRAAYIRKAKNSARKFLDSIHSPTVKIAHMVSKAIEKGLIDLGKQAGAAYWTDGGFISALPEGSDAKDFLTHFAMLPGEVNTAFQNQLRELTT